MYLLFISQFGPFTMRRKISHYTSNFCAPKTINKSHTHFTYTYMYRSIQRTGFSMHTVHSCSSHTLYNHHYRSTGGRLNVPPVKQQHSRFYFIEISLFNKSTFCFRNTGYPKSPVGQGQISLEQKMKPLTDIKGVKQPTSEVKAKISFDVCRFFFDLFHIDLRFGLVWTSPLHVTSTSKLNIVSMLTQTKRTYTRIDTNVDVNARQTLRVNGSLHDEGQRRKQYNEHCHRVNRSQGLFKLNESECERKSINNFFEPRSLKEQVMLHWTKNDCFF